MDHQNLRHLHGLRDFVRNLVEQAERSGGCECHRPPSLLLVGPPGVGKTFLVKQMSNVCDMPLFGVHTHQLAGPSSLRNLFTNARELDYPSLFFLDDIDFIFSNHDVHPGHNDFAEALRQELYKQLGPRKLKIFDPNSDHNPVQNQLPRTPSPETKRPHQEDDSPDNNGLILVAATSSPWLLYKDHELLSRFRGVYLVGLPDRETRYHLLKYLLQKVQHNMTDKEFWVVADKTEGYTPSDLLMIAKALNYEQFAFLFSMAGITSYEDSDEESITTSEMTETDTDSNYDQADGLASREKGAGDKEEKKSSSDESHSLRKNSFVSSAKVPSKNGNSTTLGLIEKDWSFGESNSSSSKEGNCKKEKSPEKEMIDENAPNIDGATTDSTVTDDNNECANEVINPSSGSAKPPVNSNCDSSSNVMNSDTDQGGVIHPAVEIVSSVSEAPCEKHETILNFTEIPSNSDDETKEFELRIVQPADPFKSDNQAVDSESDSDNENTGDYGKRTRRVNFCNVPSMHPLTVDVDHSDDLSPNISLGYEPAVSISPVLDDNLLSKDPYCGPSSNNILKRLLSSSPTLHEEMDDDNLNNKNTRNKEKSLSKEDGYLNTNYMNDYSNVDRNSVGGDETDSCRLQKENNKSEDLQIFLRRRVVVRRNSLNEDRRSLTGVSSILTAVSSQLTGVSSRLTGVSPQLTGVSPQLTGVSPRLTPTGSDSSTTSADNSSESGSGRRIRMNTPNPDSEARKTRDSDSSLYGKSDTPTIPSSEVSSATCNVSGETLECHSDSDERLRNLEDDLKGRRAIRPSDTDNDDDEEEELSGEENDNETLRTILNLNSLGEVSIKILTINDVLNVINKTPRSVSDEEIKKYTDFMVWFANVAKSACPHNSKGTLSDTASSADVSVVSSTWSQFPSTKKRKGPLRKLGRFLLKALMFILD